MDRSPKRIVLIDGEELARLMVAHDIGVRTQVCHQIKRIDEDYFTRGRPVGHMHMSWNEFRVRIPLVYADEWRDTAYKNGEMPNF